MKDPADLRFLLAIRQGTSLLAAARTLGLTPSAVTQRLQSIERRLDVRLVERSARKLHFTEEGELLCERGAALLTQFDALIDDLHARRTGVVGTLRIRAPLGFGRHYIAPAASAFQEMHPDVDIALTLSDQALSSTGDRFDVVIHIGDLHASNWVARRIAPNRRFACAAPSLLQRRGSPANPDALRSFPCIALRENNEDVTLWTFKKNRTSEAVRITAKLNCNDGDVIHQWAREGRGVILRSEWDVADDIASGTLVRLLPDWSLPDADVVALTDQRTGLPLRTRHFMQFLQARFRPLPPWRVAARRDHPLRRQDD